jgi:hypothetical protein
LGLLGRKQSLRRPWKGDFRCSLTYYAERFEKVIAGLQP